MWLPANIIGTALCAEISYRFIERRYMKRPEVPVRQRSSRTGPVDDLRATEH
jgi:hypothetical protein